MVDDCISRTEAINAFPTLLPNFGYTKKCITEILQGLPSVQPKTGHWGEHGECPYCGYLRQWEDDRYCGNCGAKMGSEEK